MLTNLEHDILALYRRYIKPYKEDQIAERDPLTFRSKSRKDEEDPRT